MEYYLALKKKEILSYAIEFALQDKKFLETCCATMCI